MNFIESIKSSIKSVLASKMRAFLTMLGIIIGISAVIIISSLGEGMKVSMNEQFEAIGANRLTVMNATSRDIRISDKDRLKIADVETVLTSPMVKNAAPIQNGGQATLKLLDPTETKNISLMGTTEAYKAINDLTLKYGRFINDNDVANALNVIVINDTTAVKVFGYEEALGQRLSIKTNRGTTKYTVIGITKNANAEMEAMFGDNFSESGTVPITTIQKLYNSKFISNISVALIDPNMADAAALQITSLLSSAHGTTDKYYVQNLANMLEQINTILGMVTLVMSAVAGISLVVGGIGVMNIMLVTVTERTREIGIRKSIGARNLDIRLQFLIEALIITTIGGILGMILGWAGGKLVPYLVSEITPVVTVSSVILAVGISTVIGIVFGVYPANKAAKLDPIDALRYE